MPNSRGINSSLICKEVYDTENNRRINLEMYNIYSQIWGNI